MTLGFIAKYQKWASRVLCSDISHWVSEFKESVTRSLGDFSIKKSHRKQRNVNNHWDMKWPLLYPMEPANSWKSTWDKGTEGNYPLVFHLLGKPPCYWVSSSAIWSWAFPSMQWPQCLHSDCLTSVL